ncbi:MAG: roadblock/LC7 domain-containing protein [Candidatus Nanohaloarchaea archaeon]
MNQNGEILEEVIKNAKRDLEPGKVSEILEELDGLETSDGGIERMTRDPSDVFQDLTDALVSEFGADARETVREALEGAETSEIDLPAFARETTHRLVIEEIIEREREVIQGGSGTGFQIVSQIDRSDKQENLPAITTSTLGTAERAAERLALGDFQDLFIRTDEGKVVIVNAGRGEAMTVLMDQDVEDGLVRTGIQETVDRIKDHQSRGEMEEVREEVEELRKSYDGIRGVSLVNFDVNDYVSELHFVEETGEGVKVSEGVGRNEVEELVDHFLQLQGDGAYGIARGVLDSIMSPEDDIDLPAEIVPRRIKEERFVSNF